MKNIFAVAIPIGLLIGMVGSGWTKDPTSSDSDGESGTLVTSLGTSVRGTVIKVDPHDASLNIKDPFGDEETVTVDAETEILRDGDDTQMANLQKGDKVLIRNPQLIRVPDNPASSTN